MLQMFVGSLNFDQRSLYLNSEIGILFHEPELSADASRRFNEHVERVAFKVELVNRRNGSKSLQWTGTTDGKKVDFDSEPYARFWKIAGVNMLRVLPIDSML